jgi:uncharacterized protein with HEPN domain
MSEKAQRRIADIFDFIEKLERILNGKSEQHFTEDEVLRLAVERLIQNIGEAAIHLPDEITSSIPDMPWKEIAGMRHILVHGYDIVGVRQPTICFL